MGPESKIQGDSLLRDGAKLAKDTNANRVCVLCKKEEKFSELNLKGKIKL